MIATRQLVMEGVWVVNQQNADIADTLHLRDVAMATNFWLSVYGVHIGAAWQIRLHRLCVAAMQPYVKRATARQSTRQFTQRDTHNQNV